ncbi:MAG: maltokinase N-terminal cap-like domain-containing protein [Frankia sp.]
MAKIYDTTMTPGKLELLSQWLPGRPWYRASTRAPQLIRVGGFRLDDPEGEVGVEFMFVTDGPGTDAVTYQVPLSYRGAPLAGAEPALIGTAEHGVLGTRWVYDGGHDPVVVTQLLALVQGEVEAQHRSRGDTVDRSVTRRWSRAETIVALGFTTPEEDGDGDPDATTIIVETAAPAGAPTGDVVVRLLRVLSPEPVENRGRPGTIGSVEAGWHDPDGTPRRGPVALVR